MGRKRQRSRAALTDDDEQAVAIVDESESAPDVESASKSPAEEDDEPTEQRKRELDVWDAFKEEHHEVLEQLPLSLHRQFKLMRELDAQGEVFHADLLMSVRRYISLRESLAAQIAQDNAEHAEGLQTNATEVNDEDANQSGSASPTRMQIDSTEPLHDGNAINGEIGTASKNASPPVALQPKPGETTRTLLQYIAQTSEEAIRTAEEKVSIAQTAYETVDRHIRLLDQVIKEQEAAISLGVRPGTHLAPILLPDLVVPRWARPSRVEHSPVPSLSPEPGLYVEEPPVLELSPSRVPSPKAPKKGKKAAPKPTKPEKEETQPLATVDGEEPVTAPRTRRATVRLTMPAQPEPSAPSVPANQNEARYCYCNRVSFGTMIACDNEGRCRLEWFHLGCTDLLEVPSKKTIWYCRECKPKMTQKGKSRT